MFYVVTGGSASGKSEFAESIVMGYQMLPRIYIATMQVLDEESRERVRRHRAMRVQKQFTTMECSKDLEKLQIPEKSVVLLECMSNLVANEMFMADDPKKEKTAENGKQICQTEEKIMSGIKRLREQCSHLVVVTNEIFSDGVHYDEVTRAYQRCLARINARMAGQADVVAEVVCGQPYDIHNKNSRNGLWPV